MIDFIKHIGSFFLDTIETIVIALAIFVVIYLFLVQPHQVKGSSMYPNFIDGEYILTDKISSHFRDYQRGDVIVFKDPKDHEIDFIKRIIGLPGETLKVEKNIYISIIKNLPNFISQKIMQLIPGYSFMKAKTSLFLLINI